MDRRALLKAAAAALAGHAGPASAQSAGATGFPARPLRMVLGFPPGGIGDTIGRTLADDGAKRLGQPVVVENRPGAATNLASEQVARSAPDGHTLLLGGSFSHAVNPALFATLPFDPDKDFVPVIRIARAPTVFAVPASLPVGSLREFIEYARREGDKVSYGSSGIGSPGHLAGEYFNRVAGLRMTHVPYKGASETVRDLLAGQLQMIVTAPTSILPLVAQGRAKALALTTPGRSRVVPGVPGSDEAGLKDFDFDGWFGFFVAGGTPMPIVERLHASFAASLKEPAIVERFEAQGITVDASESPQQFAAFLRDNVRHWAGIVARTGVKL